MDRSGFNELLNDIDKINEDDVNALEELRQKYPYYQNLHLLLAKAYKQHNSDKLKTAINKAAIYAVDRPYLKKILDGEQEFVEVIRTAPLPDPKSKLSPPPTPTPVPKPVAEKPVLTPKAEETKPVPKAKAKPEAIKPEPQSPKVENQVITDEPKTEVKQQEPTTPKVQKKPESNPPKTEVKPVEANTEIKTSAEPKPDDTPTKEESSKEDVYSELDENLKKLNERKRILSALLEDKPAVEPVKPKPPVKRKLKKERQIELIEKFIKNEPQMEKQSLTHDESMVKQKDLADIKVEHSGEFVTETLAKLMIRQKKYRRAIDIYEKLKLKFPKKTAYFATQIEKVKERSNV